jgi:hypothetical protein
VRLSTYVIGVPAVVVAAVIAVANRQSIVFSLDPFSQALPAIALRMPLFVLLFLTLGMGVLLGGLATMLTRRPPAAPPPPEQKPKSALLPGGGSGAKTPPR